MLIFTFPRFWPPKHRPTDLKIAWVMHFYVRNSNLVQLLLYLNYEKFHGLSKWPDSLKMGEIGSETQVFCILWPPEALQPPKNLHTPKIPCVTVSWDTLGQVSDIFQPPERCQRPPNGPDWCWNRHFCGFFIWKSHLHPRNGQCNPNTVKEC